MPTDTTTPRASRAVRSDAHDDTHDERPDATDLADVGAAQAAAQAAPAGAPAEPADDEYVTVLHGYGRVSATERHWLDATEFRGGVARHVPYATAKAWKKLPHLRAAIHILPDDADDTSFARASGIQPMAPAKLAAMLEASDIAAVYDALGPERTERLLHDLRQRMRAGGGR